MGFWPVKCESSPVNEILLVVGQWLTEELIMTYTRSSFTVLDSLCVNAAKNTHTHTHSWTLLWSPWTDAQTHQREPHISSLMLALHVGHLSGTVRKGMRVVPTLKPSLKVSGKMKVEREHWSMERKGWEKKNHPPWSHSWYSRSDSTNSCTIFSLLL